MSVRGRALNDVSYSQDSRFQEDTLTWKTCRISRTLHPFGMLKHTLSRLTLWPFA